MAVSLTLILFFFFCTVMIIYVFQTRDELYKNSHIRRFFFIYTQQVSGRQEKTDDTEEAQLHPHTASQSDEVSREPTTTLPALQFDQASPPEEFTEVLIQHLKGLLPQKDAETVENRITLDLWDFAGQHLYYASHPVFLSPRAVYILVHNLNKPLTEEAQPSVRQNNCDTPLRNPSSETNLDNLLSWLVSVSTMCSEEQNSDDNNGSWLNYVRPPVFIVGTHADDPCGDIKVIESKIREAVKGGSFAKHVIDTYYSISNMPGSDCKQLNDLKTKILEVLQQDPYFGLEVPLR